MTTCCARDGVQGSAAGHGGLGVAIGLARELRHPGLGKPPAALRRRSAVSGRWSRAVARTPPIARCGFHRLGRRPRSPLIRCGSRPARTWWPTRWLGPGRCWPTARCWFTPTADAGRGEGGAEPARGRTGRRDGRARHRGDRRCAGRRSGCGNWWSPAAKPRERPCRRSESAQLQIGPQIDPGVPWCWGRDGAGHHLHMALKSGNFGADDFFSKAFSLLR